MKTLFAITLLLSCVFADSLGEQWLRFKSEHNKQYSSKVEEQKRFLIFSENLRNVERHNALYENGEISYKTKIYEFSDMTHAERLEYYHLNNKFYGPSKRIADAEVVVASAEDDIPKEYDWVKKGAVTEIKNQGACGSCWAFSTTGSIEGAFYLKQKKLLSMSEQQLVDCDENDDACDGGFMEHAYKYYYNKKGMLEKDYKYTARVDDCKYDSSKAVVPMLKGFIQPKSDVMSVSKSLVLFGPHSIGIDASQDSFQTYAEGIYSDRSCSSTDLDHGVLLVGYGSIGDKDYWLVKNSWGLGWGDKGYIKILKSEKNMCGVMTIPSTPLWK